MSSSIFFCCFLNYWRKQNGRLIRLVERKEKKFFSINLIVEKNTKEDKQKRFRVVSVYVVTHVDRNIFDGIEFIDVIMISFSFSSYVSVVSLFLYSRCWQKHLQIDQHVCDKEKQSTKKATSIVFSRFPRR